MALRATELIPIYQHLHQIPEIGLQEHQTHDYLLSIIAQMPQDLLTVKLIPTLDTAILVKVSGKTHDYRIGYRTDIDALPVTENTGLPFASKHPGMMHACGHDIHMSVALGILSYFAEHQPVTDMIFMFQPAEENASGGMKIYNSGALDAEWMPDEIFGFHDNPNLPTGAIGSRMGTLFAGTCEIHAHLSGKGGHAAYPHQANDMVVAGAALVSQLQTIVARDVDPIQSGVVTLGHFTAGTIGNVIAGEAQIDGTIRALTQDMNLRIQRRVRTITEGIALAYDCNIDLQLNQGGYYPVENNDAITADFINYMQQAPNVNFIETQPAMTGEDFGYLIHQIPGTMFWLGVDSPYSLHSENMVPHTDAIMSGVDTMTGFLTHRNELRQ